MNTSINRRVIAVLLLAVVCTFTLYAGGQSEEADDGIVTLDFWTFVDAHADYYNSMVEKFNTQSEDLKIDLNVQVYPYKEMHSKLKIALQSGTGFPDLVDIEITYFPGIISELEQEFVELTSMLEPYMDDLVEARLSPYSKGEKIYGVPTHLGAAVAYYNKAILDEVGVDVDSLNTWDDIIAAGKKVLKDKDGDGEIDRYMFGVDTTNRVQYFMFARQWGSSVYNSEGDVILDRPENVKVLQMLQDFVYEDKIARVTPGGWFEDPMCWNAYNEGNLVAQFMPQWYMIRFTEHIPDQKGNIVVRPMPKFSEGGTNSTMGGGTGTAIIQEAGEIKIEAAKKFLKFAKVTKEANINIWNEFGLDPFRKDVYSEPELQEPIEYFNNEPVMNVITEVFDQIQPLYFGSKWQQANDLLNEEVLYKVIEEKESPEKVLKEAADKLRANN